ncbi:MAG: DUF3306 domain-containing protein [Amylibacter sp.]
MKARKDFWSRRKQAVEAEAEDEVAKQLVVEEEQSADALEAQTDAEVLEELGLQDPDTLEAGDDFSAFMAKAVPTRLRNRALRKLWLSNPALANLDALVDYGEDFTTSADAVEVVQTTYQVGKGLLAHVQEMARQEEAKLQVQDADEEPQAREELEEEALTEELAFAEDDEDADVEIEDDSVVVTRDESFETEVVFASKKRMRFVIGAEI